MLSKIIAFSVTFLVTTAVSIALLFGSLLAMNGFSESDASWGLGAYIILSLVIVVVMSAASVVGVHFLVKRAFSSAVAALIATLASSIIGVIATVVSSIIGIMIADFVRRNY